MSEEARQTSERRERIVLSPVNMHMRLMTVRP